MVKRKDVSEKDYGSGSDHDLRDDASQRPSLLVLDEPCQGLDMWNKATVLSLVEKICHTTDMSLLYVTHHEDELIPAIEYRLCLEDGQATYCGII